MVNYGIQRGEAIWDTTQAIEKQNHCYFSHIGTFLYKDGEILRFLVKGSFRPERPRFNGLAKAVYEVDAAETGGIP